MMKATTDEVRAAVITYLVGVKSAGEVTRQLNMRAFDVRRTAVKNALDALVADGTVMVTMREFERNGRVVVGRAYFKRVSEGSGDPFDGLT